MYNQYEELEYLSDFLPEEGESVVVSRRHGELACAPVRDNRLRDGVQEAQLYGRLVHANERLTSLASLPVWVAAMGVFWLAICLHILVYFEFSTWQWIPGQSLVVMFSCYHWYYIRRRWYFEGEVLPRLLAELRIRGLTPFELMAGVRQHPELNALLAELCAWNPRSQESPKDLTIEV